jgi:hypothetical protein
MELTNQSIFRKGSNCSGSAVGPPPRELATGVVSTPRRLLWRACYLFSLAAVTSRRFGGGGDQAGEQQ